MDREYLNLFSVPIQMFKLELNIDSLIEFCYEMKRNDEIGVEISNIGGWQSVDVLNETHTEFVKLKNKIEEAVTTYHHDIQLKKTVKQKIGNIWININGKGHSNEFHVHSYCHLSGVFYLTKSKTPIVFQHPFRDITTYFWKKSFIEKWNEVNSGEWNVLPEPNYLLVFPPWVQHRVLMNKEDTDRISLSFNTKIHETEKGND